jgi:DNA-binding transcriptional regulator YiaG
MIRHKPNSIESDLLDGFEQLANDLKSGKSLDPKYKHLRLELDVPGSEYGPKEVQQTRKTLKASRARFAKFLGVAATTVRGWETGKPVSGIAGRFMDEIRANPEYWRARLKQSVPSASQRTRNSAKMRTKRQ